MFADKPVESLAFLLVVFDASAGAAEVGAALAGCGIALIRGCVIGEDAEDEEADVREVSEDALLIEKVGDLADVEDGEVLPAGALYGVARAVDLAMGTA